jgi:uncharacterized protein YndB with AHSA1/START domain
MNKPNVFRTQRHFLFKPSEVFDAFSNSCRLSRWWGPNGFTNAFEIFEFIEGGNWKFIMTGPDGSSYPNQSIFLKIEQDKKIAIQHANQPHFTLTIDLIANNGGTQLLWTQEFEDPNVAKAMEQIVTRANEENLDRLGLNLNGKL